MCVKFKLEWTGRRSNPRLLAFNQMLNRLSYQSNLRPIRHHYCDRNVNQGTKKARSCKGNTGLIERKSIPAECYKRKGCSEPKFICLQMNMVQDPDSRFVIGCKEVMVPSSIIVSIQSVLATFSVPAYLDVGRIEKFTVNLKLFPTFVRPSIPGCSRRVLKTYLEA